VPVLVGRAGVPGDLSKKTANFNKSNTEIFIHIPEINYTDTERVFMDVIPVKIQFINFDLYFSPDTRLQLCFSQ
jgi:hypothetical protein